MKFDLALQYMLVLAIVVQFVLSFIKGRSSSKHIGEIVLNLKRSMIKQNFLLLLIIGIISYSVYSLVKSSDSVLGMLIVIYLLLCVYDFSKLKIITEKGLGNKSLYSKVVYDFAKWDDILEWEWHPKNPNLLFFTVKVKNKKDRRDWSILPTDKEKVDELLKKYIGNTYVEHTLEEEDKEKDTTEN
ncbi:DUF5673 domain-containing protein [Clostridium oceanicum]|uniref:DUF5673 domain-containing protein n=1 Tax=Clostridium oceanicum TaxID=1543 RepID=A0ABN1JNT4_9CLOT